MLLISRGKNEIIRTYGFGFGGLGLFLDYNCANYHSIFDLNMSNFFDRDLLIGVILGIVTGFVVTVITAPFWFIFIVTHLFIK